MTPCPKTKPLRDPAYLAWLRKLPCAVCGRGPCEAAHQRLLGGGTGSKPDDRYALPMCQGCHESEHRRGVVTTWNENLPGNMEYDRHSLREYLRELCVGHLRVYRGEGF